MSNPNYPAGLKRHVQGDWNCVKCSNLNFSFRFTCNRCEASKPGVADTLFNSALFLLLDENETEIFKQNSDKGSENKDPTSDFGFLKQPVKIQPFTQMVTNMEPRIIENNKVVRDKKQVENILSEVKRPNTGRSGDWVCLQCKNLNFAFRNQCNKCSKYKTTYIEL
ncbi:unnamed protein product [Blepharisma stoltei]|uniref:RanBP2-type domain-containing protein n=1 Tax=Blepharisma stoltei TaxID=1481888 RepID=A0AAU9K4X3_9CILI|nr:unnamed protein product [Blepharisma stoltei]